MEGILFAKNKDGNKILLGATEDKSKAQWHDSASNGVSEIVKKMAFNSKVDYTVEQKDGKNILTFIKASSLGGISSKPAGTPTGYSKSPEESEKIKRLSILHSVAIAVAPLTGQVDVNNIGSIIETLYDRFYQKISA